MYFHHAIYDFAMGIVIMAIITVGAGCFTVNLMAVAYKRRLRQFMVFNDVQVWQKWMDEE